LLKRFVCTHRITKWDNSIHDPTLSDGAQHIPSAQEKPRGSDKNGSHAATPKLKAYILVVEFTTCEGYLVRLVYATGR
jgi:hypothetical protein